MHRHISWVIGNYGRIAHGDDSSSRARASVKRQGCFCTVQSNLQWHYVTIRRWRWERLPQNPPCTKPSTALTSGQSGETETGITRPHFGPAVRRSKRKKVRRLSDSLDRIRTLEAEKISRVYGALGASAPSIKMYRLGGELNSVVC